MTIYILSTLLAVSMYLAIKWKVENNILIDDCADCFKRLDDSARNTYKNDYVEKLKAENERLKAEKEKLHNYLLNHNPLEL